MMAQTIFRSEKRCPRCKDKKPIDAFGPCRSRPDGHQGHCISCRTAMRREAYPPNPLRSNLSHLTTEQKHERKNELARIHLRIRTAMRRERHALAFQEVSDGKHE